MQAYFRPLAVTMFLQIVTAMLYLPVLAPAIAAVGVVMQTGAAKKPA